MTLEENLLRETREAASRWSEAVNQAESAKAEYHGAVRRLHLAGGSLREIAEELELSHQRVHQMIDEAGGSAGRKQRKAGAELACSFCGATKTEVASLVAGPGVYICDGCVTLSGQVIEQARS